MLSVDGLLDHDDDENDVDDVESVILQIIINISNTNIDWL